MITLIGSRPGRQSQYLHTLNLHVTAGIFLLLNNTLYNFNVPNFRVYIYTGHQQSSRLESGQWPCDEGTSAQVSGRYHRRECVGSSWMAVGRPIPSEDPVRGAARRRFRVRAVAANGSWCRGPLSAEVRRTTQFRAEGRQIRLRLKHVMKTDWWYIHIAKWRVSYTVYHKCYIWLFVSLEISVRACRTCQRVWYTFDEVLLLLN